MQSVPMKPTAEKLRGLLSYDPATGEFKWIVRRSGTWPGRVAGSPNASGHKQIRIDGVKHYTAHLAWLYMTGEWPSKIIDHKNRNSGDDRWANLRPCSRGENATNSVRPRGINNLPRGVHKVSSGYQARISIDGSRRHIGFFSTPEEAHSAYINASSFRAEFLPA
jgi:hypothetical protein